MSYDRVWLEESGSEDSHGRTLWALGNLAAKNSETGAGAIGKSLFLQALPSVRQFTSPRAWAYTLLGLSAYMDHFGAEPAIIQACARYTSQLEYLLVRQRSSDWLWFEDRLSYCNARLPQALMNGGHWLGLPDVVELAAASLEWLSSVQLGPDGFFEPVGSDRTYIRGETKPRFDQQPVDVYASVSAYLDAARITGNQNWSIRANHAYDWFLGENHLGKPMFNEATGAGFDGLHEDRINQNQGAESTLSFHLATAELRASVKTVHLPARYAFVQ